MIQVIACIQTFSTTIILSCTITGKLKPHDLASDPNIIKKKHFIIKHLQWKICKAICDDVAGRSYHLWPCKRPIVALCLVLHVLIKFNKALHSEISLNSASVYSLTKLPHQNVSFGRNTRSESMFNKLSITYDVLTARNQTPEISPQITWKHF